MPTKIKLQARLAAPLFVTALTLCSAVANAATTFNQINLVTNDQAANAAQTTDSSLKNAWGLSYSPGGPVWISDNGSGASTFYTVNPVSNATSKVPLTVSIPGDGSVTGQVYNAGAGFNGDTFIFVSEDGTISGWSGASGAQAATLKPAAAANVYKGAAEAVVGGESYLYAANFRAGGIDVIPGSATAPALNGNFNDPNLPVGYAPFNIQDLGGNLYVTYALQDAAKHDEIAGQGNGYVDEFDSQGHLLNRIASQGALDAPWGLAIAPASFGEYAGDLLVGNFGDGKINAYNPLTHEFAGQLSAGNGQPLVIDGLWAISVGNNGGGGSAQMLYFTAGPNAEADGLFGALSAVPLPGGFWLFSSALLGFAWFGKRRAS